MRLTRPHRLAVLALAAALVAPAARAGPPAGRVIEITARRFEFSPSVITLDQGQPVTLRVRSLDVTHGLFLRSLGIDATLAPGKVVELTVTPASRGRFTAICDHFCGAGHGNMKLTVEVR